MALENNNNRRFDLDWLRVFSVTLVFFHHAGMPFNGDNWHIMNAQSSKMMDDIMVYFEQWRLPLLLFISGAGTVMAFSKRTTFQFVKERSRRLLVPLIFGVLVITPPQTYYQFIDQYKTYLDVYPEAILKAKTNHLWFIEILFVFSIIAIPLILFLRTEKSIRFLQLIEKICAKRYGMLLFVIPLIAILLVTKKYYPDDSNKISNLSSSLYYLFFFLVGIVTSSSKELWPSLLRNRRFNLIASIISLMLFYGFYYFPDELISPYVSIPNRWRIWWIVCSLVGWSTIISILGYAQVYLNAPYKWLPKFNEAVYPFYILHQTVIIVIGYYILQWDANIPVKLIALAISSFGGVILIYRLLIYPFNVTRFFFGMKPKRA